VSLPVADWPGPLRLAVDMAAAQRAFDVMLGGGVSPAFDRARRKVLEAIDAALRAGATEADVDAVLASQHDERVREDVSDAEPSAPGAEDESPRDRERTRSACSCDASPAAGGDRRALRARAPTSTSDASRSAAANARAASWD